MHRAGGWTHDETRRSDEIHGLFQIDVSVIDKRSFDFLRCIAFPNATDAIASFLPNHEELAPSLRCPVTVSSVGASSGMKEHVRDELRSASAKANEMLVP